MSEKRDPGTDMVEAIRTGYTMASSLTSVRRRSSTWPQGRRGTLRRLRPISPAAATSSRARVVRWSSTPRLPRSRQRRLALGKLLAASGPPRERPGCRQGRQAPPRGHGGGEPRDEDHPAHHRTAEGVGHRPRADRPDLHGGVHRGAASLGVECLRRGVDGRTSASATAFLGRVRGLAGGSSLARSHQTNRRSDWPSWGSYATTRSPQSPNGPTRRGCESGPGASTTVPTAIPTATPWSWAGPSNGRYQPGS